MFLEVFAILFTGLAQGQAENPNIARGSYHLYGLRNLHQWHRAKPRTLSFERFLFYTSFSTLLTANYVRAALS